MTIHWLQIIYVLASILAWPISAFVWGKKIKNWKTTSALGAAILVGILSLIVGFLLTDFFRFYIEEKIDPFGVLFPLFWMTVPILITLIIYLSTRKKTDKVN